MKPRIYATHDISHQLDLHMSNERPTLKRSRLSLGRAAFAGSLVLFVFIAVCYWRRFDGCAAITVFPAWAWMILGLLVAVVQCWLHQDRLVLATVTLWLLLPLLCADAPESLLRGAWRTLRPGETANEARSIRVVTLNCAATVQAAVEAAALEPDLLLLQESPSASQLETLCKELYGEEGQMLWGPDCSILARGEVASIVSPAAQRGECVLARVRLASGVDLVVASLRLHPVPLRLDLWSPDCWRAYTENRRIQRRQLQAIVNDASSHSDASLLILGGDFNAPAGDAVFDALPPELSDAFRTAGVGWGNTILNAWPVHRIDQIWAGSRLRAITAYAHATRHSDHRMVVGEFVVDTIHSRGQIDSGE